MWVFLGKMAEELETLWQKLRAAVERGRNCVFMKVLSRRGLMIEALRKNIRML